MTALTRALGEFVGGSTDIYIPEEARAMACRGFIDCVATMIAGQNEPASSLLVQVLDPSPGKSTLFFGSRMTDAPTAAWINATAAHAMDYDDVAFQSHPSAVLVPAILAEAQELGECGANMLDAYVVGYEVWGALACREQGALHLKGWHPTGVWGAVAAAAACARLRRLDATQSTNALALGASQSAGLMANFGSMAKPFHAGKAAHAGVIAARLAQAGFTGSNDALEHEQGLLAAVSQTGDTDRHTPFQLADAWRIQYEGLSLKKYPACYATHRAIDAVKALLESRKLQPDEIKQITILTNLRYATILRNHSPKTGLEAKFSMQFAVAAAVIANKVSLEELQDQFVCRADVQQLMKKIIIDPSQGLTNTHGSYEQADIHLHSGERLVSDKVTFPRGHFHVPLEEEEIRNKFYACLEWAGKEDAAPYLYQMLSNLQSVRATDLGHTSDRNN
ncbi:MAG TPA: MmgE/PrpD family protein [Eoetvoesiella sp.]